MIKDKELKNFILQLNKDLDLMDPKHRKVFIMKFVLLKWLVDHHYIQWNRSLYFNLSKEFTFGNILYSWGGIKPVFQDCNHGEFFTYLWSTHSEQMLERDILSIYSSDILGGIYEYLNNIESKKKRGIYYTPSMIIECMIKGGLKEDLECQRIIDPACGCGFFLSKAYDLLMEYYLKDKKFHPMKAHRIIIEKQLFGLDIDGLAVQIAKLILLLKQTRLIEIEFNIYCQDALLDNNEKIKDNSFSLVIGNPPYIGHKKLDKVYKLQLKDKYGQVYHDKGDISYCFFQKGYQLLKPAGQLIFIVARYFLEALHGTGLREFIGSNTKVFRMVDFYGQRIIKGAGIDPLIIHLFKEYPTLSMKRPIEVFRLKTMKEKIIEEKILKMILNKEASPYIQHFFIQQKDMKNSGWRLLHPIAESILEKIEGACIYRLGDICISRQGIITGRDEAFVLSNRKARTLGINGNLLKPWLKGKDISPFTITNGDRKLLYTNGIKNLEEDGAVYHHLIKYKEVLEKRRECVRGVRKWYELQWGRDRAFFESEKIIFPYKSNSNKFALDENGYYYSADVYGLRLIEDFYKKFSYSTLIILLNSRTYDFYFKCFGKKLGNDLYEYYPNTVMRLAIPNIQPEDQKYLDSLYCNIQDSIKKGNQKEVENIREEVNGWLMEYFAFTEAEMEFMNPQP